MSKVASAAPIAVIEHGKKRARINAIRYYRNHFDYPDKRQELLQVDRRIVRTVEEELGVED